MIFKLFRDKRGNMAVITAILALPVFGVVGMALDYANASWHQQHLQVAADAAVLAAATSNMTSLVDLTKVAQDVFNANIGTGGYGNEKLTLEVDDASRIIVRVSAIAPVTLAAVIRPGGIPVGVLAAAVPGRSMNIDIALVLDNTTSMNNKSEYGTTRIADLKTAVRTMLAVLKLADPSLNRIKVGLVPFAEYVNVGVANRNLAGLDVVPDYQRQDCQRVQIKSGCVMVPAVKISDGMTINYTKEQCASITYGDEICTMVPVKWKGCVGSYLIDKGNPTDGARYPGLMDTSCATAITPLTSINTALYNAVTLMKAPTSDALTYIAPAVLWGWRILSPQPPFTQGRPLNGTTLKYMILMTDGENTRGASYPKHELDAEINSLTAQKDPAKKAAAMANRAIADQETLVTCEAAKKADITIYTVTVGSVDQAAIDLMTACASRKDTAMFIEDSYSLADTFSKIAKQIDVTRLVM